MSSDILLKSIKSDFAAELKNNKKLAELIKKATDGKGTFTDVSQFSAACGEALSDVLAKNITLDMLRDGSVSYEDINTILQDTLRQNYELVNRMAQAVQKQTDAKLNVHIEPQKAEFPTERVSRIASALIDKTASDEQLRRRMRSPIENITDSFYSDYVEVNADKRSRAGMRTYLIRQTNGKCCAWCSSLAGRYDYPNGAPENIFSRHDNCTCTVDYITDKHRQDVWSKRKYALTPEQRERILANAPPPTRFSREQAQRIQENVLNRLANSANSGIINIRRFNSQGDPMYEVTGSAFESNPKEVQKIIDTLKEWGVEVNYSSSTLGYGSNRVGYPGGMSVTKDASYSAWCHEFQHVKDDREAGWNGALVLWTDSEERIRRETKAYAVEIDLARKAGREDIVKRLEANLDDEIRKIRKSTEEYQ